MKAWFAVAIVLAVEAVALFGYAVYMREPGKPVPAGKPTPANVGPEWVNLLDTQHAPLWKNVNDDKSIFEMKDGMLHIFGVTLTPLRYVGYTGEMFGDFDLHLEFMVTQRANSGVFIRKQPGDEVKRGFEIQVLDDFGKAPTKNTSGALYDVVTPMFNMSRPAGEWNSFDISTRGKQVIVYMNGWLVLYVDLGMMKSPLGKFEYAFNDLPLSGMLALQDHGGEVWYRNIQIHPFKGEDAKPVPAPASEPAKPAGQ